MREGKRIMLSAHASDYTGMELCDLACGAAILRHHEGLYLSATARLTRETASGP